MGLRGRRPSSPVTVRPIPVVFHVGPLTFHTYGLGLALTALFALWWADRRLTHHEIAAPHFSRDVAVLFLVALFGARIAHVTTNWSSYAHQPAEMVAVWHGGLSSYGGLAFAIPLSLWRAPSWWPGASRRRVADVLSPVVVGSWGVGRLLGPQLMVAGGGHVTTAWWGMHYAGQVGSRVPVPLIQGIEDLLLAWILVRLPRRGRSGRVGSMSCSGRVVITRRRKECGLTSRDYQFAGPSSRWCGITRDE